MANLQPLNWQVPLVNPDRTPTSEFQRAWASLQTAAGDIPALDTAAEVSAVLDKLGATPGSLLRRTASGWEVITGAAGDLLKRGVSNWDVLPSPSDPAKYLAGDLTWQSVPSPNIQTLLDSISSTRGVVLYRGNAGWAALPPGTSGDFLKTNGAGADPVWAAGGGGGGSGTRLTTVASAGSVSVQTTAYASRGQLVQFYESVKLHSIRVNSNPMTAGRQFTAHVITQSGGTITSVVGSTSTFTYVSGPTVAVMPFSTPLTLAANTLYIICVSWTNAATDTTVLRIPGGSPTWPLWQGMPADLVDLTSAYRNCVDIPLRVPIVGGAGLAFSSGTRIFDVEWSL